MKAAALAVTTILLGLAAAGCGSAGDVIVTHGGHFGTGVDDAAVGEPLLMPVLQPIQVSGDRPVHLLGAELYRVPPGLVVDGIWAIRYSDPGQPPHLGGDRGWIGVRRVRPYNHDIRTVVLDPHCPPQANCHPTPDHLYQDWYLYAQVHLTHKSRDSLETAGVTLLYEVDGAKHVQTVTDMTIFAKSGGT